MSAMASQITCISIVTQPFVQAQIKETSKLCITGLCEENSPVTGEFPAQKASDARNAFDDIMLRSSGHWDLIVLEPLDMEMILEMPFSAHKTSIWNWIEFLGPVFKIIESTQINCWN